MATNLETRKQKINFLTNLQSGKNTIDVLAEPETFIPASYFPERLLKNKSVAPTTMLCVSTQQEFTPLQFANMLASTSPDRINMVFLNEETTKEIKKHTNANQTSSKRGN